MDFSKYKIWNQTLIINVFFTPDGFLDINKMALYAYNGVGDGKLARYSSQGVLPPTNDKIIFDRRK